MDFESLKTQYKRPLDVNHPFLDGTVASLCAGVAATIAKTAQAPLLRATLLVRVPTEEYKRSQNIGFWHEFRNHATGLKRAIQGEGLRALWRGNLTIVARYVPPQVLNYGFFTLLYYNGGFDAFSAGTVAGSAAMVALYPVFRAQFLLQAQAIKLRRSIAVDRVYTSMQDVFQKESIGIYRGLPAHLLSAAIFRGTAFGAYFALRGEDAWIRNLVLAYGAAMLGSYLSEPVDLITQRLQQAELAGKSAQYSGAWDCFQKMMQKEGFTEFWKPPKARSVFRALIQPAALTLFLFDMFFSSLRKRDTKPKNFRVI